MKHLLQTFLTPNFRNKKYISEIPASVNDGIAWSSIGNNDEMWTIWKYWRVTKTKQKMKKPNLERQWMTFVYGFYLSAFSSLVKDPNRRCQRMEFKANRTTRKLEGKIQLKKNYCTCEEIGICDTSSRGKIKVNMNRPWDDPDVRISTVTKASVKNMFKEFTEDMHTMNSHMGNFS